MTTKLEKRVLNLEIRADALYELVTFLLKRTAKNPKAKKTAKRVRK